MNGNLNQVSNQEILNGIQELQNYFVVRLQKCNEEVESTYNRMVSSGALNSERTNSIIEKIKEQLAGLEEEFKTYSNELANSMNESSETISSAQNTIETELGSIN